MTKLAPRRRRIEGITYPHVEEYLESLLRRRGQPLKRMEEEAEREGIPIIGPVVGPLLTLTASMIKAERVLEIGTAIGYSAIWLAMAVKQTNGLVTTVEIDPQRASEADANIREAGLSKHVKILRGDIMKLLPQLAGSYDLIFLDTAKELYLKLLEPAVLMLREGGILMADNVLWSGLVSEPGQDEVADIMREFNARLYRHPKLLPIILPFRDGVAVCQKTG